MIRELKNVIKLHCSKTKKKQQEAKQIRLSIMKKIAQLIPNFFTGLKFKNCSNSVYFIFRGWAAIPERLRLVYEG